MGRCCTLVLTVFLALVLVNCSLADLEEKGDSKTGEKGKGLDVVDTNNSGNDKKEVIPDEKSGKDQKGDGSKRGAENNVVSGSNDKEGNVVVKEAGNDPKKSNDTADKNQNKPEGGSKELGSNGEQKKSDDTGADKKSNLDGIGKQLGSQGVGSEQKKTVDTGSERKKTIDEGNEKDGENKEKSRTDANFESKGGTLGKEGGEACDSSSNSCIIKDKSVVACLRVPGDESLDLSLLIQNKGKGTVVVTINAPHFVKLEHKQVQVQENNSEKVRVSLGNGETESNITLIAGNGNCTLDFKQLITRSSGKVTGFSQKAYIDLLKSTSIWWVILLAAVLVIASVWIGVSFRRKYAARNNSKYEKLEMELPVSGVNKTVSDPNDGWDDNWGDSWDDEEVALTPSMPVTPSFSSNGIAPRRINKDAWKD